MLKFKLCVSVYLSVLFVPFGTSVLYGITNHKSQHMLPGEISKCIPKHNLI